MPLDWRTRRIVVGTALYDLNDRWTRVTGRYGYDLLGSRDLPGKPRLICAQSETREQRRKRLEQELKAAVARMDFKRAEVLKGVLFPTGPLYAIWSERNRAYFAINYCGYRNNLAEAGHYARRTETLSGRPAGVQGRRPESRPGSGGRMKSTHRKQAKTKRDLQRYFDARR